MCRDIGGSDPERMAAPNVATYVKELFVNTPIQVEVIEDVKYIEKEYPLLGAVNRAAKGSLIFGVYLCNFFLVITVSLLLVKRYAEIN